MRLFNYVSPGYFHSVGTHLVAGRDYTWTDIYGLRPVAIVSENLARESWGSAAAAIGKRFRILPTQTWQEVIGVAENVQQNGVDEAAPAIVYWPAMMPNPFVAGQLHVHARGHVRGAQQPRGNESLPQRDSASSMASEWQPSCGVDATMGEIYSRSMARTSFTLVMLAIAGAMALALSLIGIYGVDLLRRIATHPRNRHSHGARRPEGRTALDVRALRLGD